MTTQPDYAYLPSEQPFAVNPNGDIHLDKEQYVIPSAPLQYLQYGATTAPEGYREQITQPKNKVNKVVKIVVITFVSIFVIGFLSVLGVSLMFAVQYAAYKTY